MPHITLDEDLPGIAALLAYKSATGAKLADLVEQLLRGPSGLSAAERETIAAHVSRINDCDYCAGTHGAAARALEAGPELREAVATGAGTPGPSPKMAALLALAATVVPGGKHVTERAVAAARDAGANDEDIHDTVLIAAAFCMLNRYVDGLATRPVPDEDAYTSIGERLAERGYARR